MSIMHTKTDSEIRAAVKEIYGSNNAKVTRNGEVHVRGVMPNTNQTGWFLLGYTGQIELEEKLFYPDGSIRA
jgi:hypothetical protein